MIARCKPWVVQETIREDHAKHHMDSLMRHGRSMHLCPALACSGAVNRVLGRHPDLEVFISGGLYVLVRANVLLQSLCSILDLFALMQEVGRVPDVVQAACYVGHAAALKLAVASWASLIS